MRTWLMENPKQEKNIACIYRYMYIYVMHVCIVVRQVVAKFLHYIGQQLSMSSALRSQQTCSLFYSILFYFITFYFTALLARTICCCFYTNWIRAFVCNLFKTCLFHFALAVNSKFVFLLASTPCSKYNLFESTFGIKYLIYL